MFSKKEHNFYGFVIQIYVSVSEAFADLLQSRFNGIL